MAVTEERLGWDVLERIHELSTCRICETADNPLCVTRCLHHVCAKCMDRIERRKNGKIYFQCPFCREESSFTISTYKRKNCRIIEELKETIASYSVQVTCASIQTEGNYQELIDTSTQVDDHEWWLNDFAMELAVEEKKLVDSVDGYSIKIDRRIEHASLLASIEDIKEASKAADELLLKDLVRAEIEMVSNVQSVLAGG